MLTGIRVLTLVELAFWFIRLFSRRCFRPSTTDIEKPVPCPKQKDERMDALEERNNAIEKEISMIKNKMLMKSKYLGKRTKTTISRQ